MSTTGASMNRHRSNTTYATPPDFMSAITNRFGPIGFDLAATPKQQQRNRRDNVYVQTPKGRMLLIEAAEVFNIPYLLLKNRYHRPPKQGLFGKIRVTSKHRRGLQTA